MGLSQLLGLQGGRPFQGRAPRRAAARRGQAALFHLVEEGGHRIIVGLGDQVVLVVVTLGAANGQAEEILADQLRALVHVIDAELFVDRAPLGVLTASLEEGGSQELLAGGVRKLVAGELPRDELVVGHVALERADHPVAVGVGDRAFVVVQAAAGVGVAGDVEPDIGLALGGFDRCQQAVDQLLVGVRILVVHERVDFREGRRQAGQVESDAVDQGLAVGLR